MKILRLELMNLGSLYGEQVVDLEEDLGNAPLFLVRGPTGAGKSTLLDAICLALFGVTPRLARSRSSADTDPAQVMSRGTGQARARVVVELQGATRRQRWRVTWDCRRAHRRPDGDPQPPVRTLERWADGAWQVIVSSSQRKVWGEPFARLVDEMTVEDFQRTVLLAQGEFAAFLAADDRARAEILERDRKSTRLNSSHCA